jgi:cysteinyl-tRNA synthetase
VVKNTLVNSHEKSQQDGRSIFEANQKISWYSCGPTVYDDAHIGHGRTYVCTDIIRRILVDYHCCNVDFAMGITDIDDKIIERAQKQGKNEWAEMLSMVRDLENDFFMDMDQLSVRRPDAVLRVTEHIDEIISYIETIQKSNRAYVANDGVYFSVPSCGDKYIKFLEISHESPVAAPSPIVDAQHAVEAGSHRHLKRDKRDFALWKAAKPGEPSWPSPWGNGRPGWHIECSAVTHSYFGNYLDIHSGGVDLKFPHHTNEIAQSEAFNECCAGQHHQHQQRRPDSRDWVKCWIHTGHLYIEGRKMSKSLKNFITIREYLKGGYSSHPAVDFRIFCLQHKYHSSVHFSQDRIDDAGAFRRKVENFLRNINAIVSKRAADETTNSATETSKSQQSQSSSSSSYYTVRKPTEASRKLLCDLRECRRAVHAALSDDFDTPEALRLLSKLIGEAMQYTTLVAVDRDINNGDSDSDSKDTAKQRYNHPVEPLLAVADYVRHILNIFGVVVGTGDPTSPAVGVAGASLGSAELGGSQGVSATAVMDALVSFRTRVRNAGLKGMKSMKIPKKAANSKDHLSSDAAAVESDAVKAAAVGAKEALGEVLKACDWVRDAAAPKLGVKIEDVSSDLSTWRSEKP